MLEEGDLPLPVKEHEKIARRLERKEREMQALQKELAASKATGERWISRSMAAEARAARAEATGTVLEKQSDSMAAQVQLMKTQKQAAVAKVGLTPMASRLIVRPDGSQVPVDDRRGVRGTGG